MSISCFFCQVAAAERLGLLGLQRLDRLGQRGGFDELEFVHAGSPAWRCRLLGGHAAGRILDRLDDVLVAGAAAEIAPVALTRHRFREFGAKRSFAQRFGLSGGGAGANAPAGLAAEAAHAAVEALETRAAWSRFGA